MSPAKSLSTKRLTEKFLFYVSVMWIRALNASLNQYTQVVSLREHVSYYFIATSRAPCRILGANETGSGGYHHYANGGLMFRLLLQLDLGLAKRWNLLGNATPLASTAASAPRWGTCKLWIRHRPSKGGNLGG